MHFVSLATPRFKKKKKKNVLYSKTSCTSATANMGCYLCFEAQTSSMQQKKPCLKQNFWYLSHHKLSIPAQALGLATASHDLIFGLVLQSVSTTLPTQKQLESSRRVRLIRRSGKCLIWNMSRVLPWPHIMLQGWFQVRRLVDHV